MIMRANASQSVSDTLPLRERRRVVTQTAPACSSYFHSASVNQGLVQRKSDCACGGSCPRCSETIQTKLNVSTPGDVFELEADQIAEQVMRTPAPALQRSCAGCATGGTTCPSCAGEDGEIAVQRKPARSSNGSSSSAEGFSQHLGSGESLDSNTRTFFESRFGYNFGHVRIHRDSRATESAQSVDALAYTAGHDIVFQSDQYLPHTYAGQKLIAHELTHVVQQGRGGAPGLQRTPARKVSCANRTPLRVPGAPPVEIADPVGVITAAEDRANEMFDAVIDELDATRSAIIAGAPAGAPTVPAALAEGLRLMGLDPDDAGIWTAPAGTGRRSVPLLIRRLRLIRSTIGAGSFFFFCLGTGMTRLGTCTPPAGDPDICTDAVAATCEGEFLTAFCPSFWTNSAEDQAARIVHESAHNFASFIGHTGRFTNAECFARLVQVFAGVPEAEQRVDLCPNP